MSRRLGLILSLVVAVVAAGGIALVASQKPDLDDGRGRVDHRWRALREPLAPRYDELGAVVDAFRGAGAGDRDVTHDLETALSRWNGFTTRPGDPGQEAELANELEALAARARANQQAYPRLSADQALHDAFARFDTATVAAPAVRSYNRAVRAYQEARDGTLASLVAGIFGYDARPTFVIPRPAA